MLIDGLAKAGWQVPRARAPPCSAGRRCPSRSGSLGSLGFAKLLLEEAEVAVAPGIGFGEYGEGYVRLARGREPAPAASGGAQHPRLPARGTATGSPAAGARCGMSMRRHAPVRIGIAGLGTVGAATFRLLRDNAELLAPAHRTSAGRHRRERPRPRRASAMSTWRGCAGTTMPAPWPRTPRSTWSAS